MKRFVIILLLLAVAVLIGGLFSLKGRPLTLLVMTPDQLGQRLYNQGRFEEAARWFQSASRQGAALYRNGDFKDAAGRFAGSSSAEGLYNQGNALAMQGRYGEAAERYFQALELRPDWSDAEMNLEIARRSAARLEQTGGEATELGADAIVFSNKKKDPPSEQQAAPDQAMPMDEGSMQAIWLRQVQTRPSDFLRTKFAYQNAMQEDFRK